MTMQAEPSPYEADTDDVTGGHLPVEEPVGGIPATRERRPIVTLFSRRAFLSKDTGRWHKLTGGRDRRGDEPAVDRDPGEAN